MSTLERELGGREAVVDGLSDAASPSDARKAEKKLALIALLRDPANSHLSLARIAKLAGVSVNDFYTYCLDSVHAQSVVHAQIIAAKHLPDVMTDIINKSIDQRSMCVCTLGPNNTTVQPKMDCKKCFGRGFTVERSSFDHQEMVMKMTGMLKSEPAIVNKNQVVNAFGKHVADAFVKTADDTLVFDVTPTETAQ